MTEHKNLTAKEAIQNFQNAFGYTNEAIIRALECCANGECDECPYQDNSPCKEYLNNATLDLINRQRAEIDDLQLKLSIAIDDIQNHTIEKTRETVIRFVAVKEFAEKLKLKMLQNHGLINSYTAHKLVLSLVDILVEEIAGGDQNGNNKST